MVIVYGGIELVNGAIDLWSCLVEYKFFYQIGSEKKDIGLGVPSKIKNIDKVKTFG